MRDFWLIFTLAAMILVSSGWAEESQGTTDQPYIDSIKKNLPPSQGAEGYTDRLKQKLPGEPPSEGYTEQLRKDNPALQLQGTPDRSYTEELNKKLPPKEPGGAIAAVNRGESDLKEVKSTDIHNAIGIRIGLVSSRNYTANDGIGTGRAFSDVYGNSFVPDIQLFAEHQFFHSERFASAGVFGMLGLAYFSGLGTFAIPLTSGYNGQAIAKNATGTTYRFWQVPATAGGTFRLNLGYFRPYVMGGPTGIYADEFRSDGGTTNHALGLGVWGAIGVAFLVDWINKDVDWDAYADYGLKHTYFTVEYSGTSCFSPSSVDFNMSGLYAGVTFEY